MASCTGRSVQLEEDDLPYRKGSNATIRSEGTGTEYYAKHGILPTYESTETVGAQRPISTASTSSMRVRRLSSLTDSENTRFPKLQDCAHFHYDTVDINNLKVCLSEDDSDLYHHHGECQTNQYFFAKITSNDKTWLMRRNLQNFRMLDQKLHRCIFDRKFSHLPDLALLSPDDISFVQLRGILGDYLLRFTSLAGSMLNCGSVLNWLEIDNRGNRLLSVDDSGINTPAIAAAHAVKRYTAQAADEISLEVGDIVSVIDMPPNEDTIWWRGKRGFEVGFFPYECVEVIGDKVPDSMVSGIPETPANRALLKRHGKFISFLRLFFNNRPERIQLKQSGIVKERVFGCDLGEHLLNSGHDVPLVLKSCADVLETHGLVDGIYRLSGITSNIQKLRLAFDEDRVPDLTSEEYLQDVHSISSLLKMYFRELPNPLLTYQLYDKFADAVRDEENKLLRIHDVVQQLPPPHYRTTEYLMRHLSRVAAQGRETGMHSKNLAIVWAPNLLRSKELETGGGAAALRGVGIQAVVTEFLILYAELIFSDKMPSYSSPELKKTQRKPRPKSLAISTPTRLLTLEEARERALLGSIVKADQRYIDVGGGPSSLPAKYHTVIDLPGYKKKSSSKEPGGGKVKKSPGGGLKSLFSRSRSGSIRQKGRKPSIHESLNFEPGERKAITEEDVQHWKRRRIRSAKSAESLLSLPITSRLGSPLTESLDPHRLMNILAGKDSSPTKFSRSMSIESPRSLSSSQEHSVSYPTFILEDDGRGREMAIDVNPEDIQLDFNQHSDREKSESPEDGVHRKQSFVRNETKRRVIGHRRTPSAPTTPRHDRHDVGSSCKDVDDTLQQFSDNHKDRSVSQPMLEGALSSKPPRGAGKYVQRQDSENERFYLDSIMPESQNGFSRNSDENGSEKRKGSKTPPKDRKKLKEEKEKSPFSDGKGVKLSPKDRIRHGSGKENISNVPQQSDSGLITELPESPGSKRKLWTNSTSSSEEQAVKMTHYIYSRHHDYAEINDEDILDSVTNQESQLRGSVAGEQGSRNSLNKSDSAIYPISDGSRRYRVESIDNIRNFGVESQNMPDRQSQHVLETDFPASSMNRGSLPSSFPNSDNKIHGANSASRVETDTKYQVGKDLLVEISNLEQGIQSIQQQQYAGKQSMSKCISIPSDIQRSLENIRSVSDSHSLMSSTTISELSMSQDNVFGNDIYLMNRRRRSTSLDGLNDESPLSRTLREINAQIDQAFKHEKHKAQSLRNLQTSPSTPKGSVSEIESELISYSDELAVTPTGQRSYGSMRDVILESPCGNDYEKERSLSFDRNAKTETISQPNQNNFVDRPAAEIHIVEAPRVIRAPLRPGKVGDTVTTTPTPTRPSPPASLDIVSTTISDHQKSPAQLKAVQSSNGTHNVRQQNQTPTREQPVHSPYVNIDIPPKTDFRITEEDFQKFLMSDPDSMRQFEQSMMYSPVRSERSNRSSIMSPVEGVVPRARSNRSSLASPEASPGSFTRHPHNRSFGSPEASPQSVRQQHNQSFSSSEASPQTGARHKHNQSYSTTSSEASPQSTRQKHNQSFSSSEASPQTGARHKHNQSYSSSEASPQTGSRQKHGYGASPQLESKRYGHSPNSDRKKLESPQHDKRSFTQHSPKIEKQRKNSSNVSSPLSPEHKQPRWEDLAGLNDLNDSFNELDLAVFNENWKKCLAPTGDSVRLSNAVSDSNEQLANQNEFPEVGTGTDTVILERPSIRRKTGVEGIVTVIDNVKQSGKSKLSEIETYDNVPEHESYILPQETRTDNRTIMTERPSMKRSNTVPTASSVPQSPTFRSGRPGGAFLEHSSSFESSSSSVPGLVREVSFELSSATNSSATIVERPSIRKSNTTPALTRQTSFDSSYRSMRVTSMGSSLDEPDVVSPEILPSLIHEVIKSASASQSAFSVTSHHSNQSSVLIRSESSQSTDFSYPDINQSNRPEHNSNQSNSSVGSLLPQMLEEMDVNESCLGIASHQNLSNEMKEMMQEQLKEHAGVLSPLDDIIAPFSGLTSPLSQPRSFFDTNHPLAGFDMESSIEVPSDVQSVDLPEMNLQYLIEGPTLIATPMVLSQLDLSDQPPIHQPIDNTEEEFQNAVNDDLERNLASLTDYLPRHVGVCEPSETFRNQIEDNDDCCHSVGQDPNDGSSEAAGLEHMLLISPTSSAIMDTPEPVTQNSMSSSSSSSMSSSFTYPQCFDSKHYYSPRVNSLNIQGDLAPPPLEMIEICKSTLVHSKPPSGKKAAQTKDVIWKYPKILTDDSKTNASKKSDKISTTSSPQSNISSERGEEKLLMNNRPSLKKGGNVETKSKPQCRQLTDIADSDHGDLSGTEDEVFVDPSEVTSSTNYYAAGSKYFKRRDFISYGHFPSSDQKKFSDDLSSLDSKRFNFENSARCSMDESMMQMVSSRHDDLLSRDTDPLSGYHDDLFTMDIGHEHSEDIRFSKAHRSSKLLSLCEKFENGSGQSLNSEDGENETENKKTITPPEKNIVLSIRQMHESLEVDTTETEKSNEVFGKPQKVRKVSLDEPSSKDDVNTCASHVADVSNSCLRSPLAVAQGKDKEIPKAQGKPPKYRSNSKTRTPSESSLSENEGIKGSPKSSRLDGSPRSMKYESSPKGQRHSLVSSDEGSPKLFPSAGSPKGQRYSTEISPKLARGKEGVPPAVPRHAGSPKLQKSSSGSKIPVKLASLPKDETKYENGNVSQGSTRYGSSPKSLRSSVGSTGSDGSPKSATKGDKSEKEVKSHRTRRGESVEERYKLNFERQSPTRVHFEAETVKQRVTDKSDKNTEEKKKRRGSIKELTHVFEEKIETISKQCATSQSPPQSKLRSRVRSVSPTTAANISPTMPKSIRHSMELTSREMLTHPDAMLKHMEGNIKQQTVRIGPKPFYGAKQ